MWCKALNVLVSMIAAMRQPVGVKRLVCVEVQVPSRSCLDQIGNIFMIFIENLREPGKFWSTAPYEVYQA